MTMVGTFKRQKGHVHLLDAAASVAGQLAGLHIVLVGDGELAEAIEARVAALGLDGRIHLLGTRRDVPELLAASDSFVLPSLWEGLPVALVEAMASRMPVIASAVSGTSQVMVAGVTGWVVPPGDPDALARAMVELVSDPSRAATMADAAADRSAAFSAAAQAEQLVALFRREGPAPPAPRPRMWVGRRAA
jgi:glycosyltransferase involved in cell wall biosynthesis